MPLLLRAWGQHMDAQINTTGHVMDYLPKYLTKSDTHVGLAFGQETAKDFFKGRKIGIVQAAYELLGYHWHQSSIGVVYTDTTMPGYIQRASLKKPETIRKLPEGSEDIYASAHVQKYLGRDEDLKEVIMVEYFRAYKITKYMQENDDLENHVEAENASHYTGVIDRDANTNRKNKEKVPTRYVPELGKRLPVHTTDKNNFRYVLRKKLPLYRTYEANLSDGDQVYYQNIVLHSASFDFEAECGERTWKEYFHVLLDQHKFDGKLTEQYIESLLEQEKVYENQEHYQQGERYDPHFNLEQALETASAEQINVFDHIVANPRGVYVVHGGAGVGKSFLLKMIYTYLSSHNFIVQKLAPTGVAATNVFGQTLHRYFGIANAANIINPVRLDEHFKKYETTNFAFLIDEMSMVSEQLLEDCSRQLMFATERHAPFGGVLMTILFGDFGQLTPIKDEEQFVFKAKCLYGAKYFSLVDSQRLEQDENRLYVFLNTL